MSDGWLQACLNGARDLSEHERLSADPSAVAREARAAVTAGAREIHLHPKGADGRDSLHGDDVARFVDAVRLLCPGTPVGVTTGAWAATGPSDRPDAIRSWTSLPDFASVNWHEDGADEVAEALLVRGIGVEAGIWHSDGLGRWADSPRRKDCFRVLVELPDTDDAVVVGELAAGLRAAIGTYEPAAQVLLHGEQSSAWPTLDLALGWGLRTRIGLEDTLRLPDGRPAPGNAALVDAALVRHDALEPGGSP